MVIESFIRVALNAGLETLVADAWPQLKPGDRLTLRVIDLRERQRALIDFGRFRVLAEMTFPVAIGDELVVKVLDTKKGQLHLGLVESSSAKEHPLSPWNEPLRPFTDDTLGQVRVHLGHMLTSLGRLPKGETAHTELSQILAGLRSFMESLHRGSGAENISRRLQSLCEDSGVFFEKRLEAALLQTAVAGDAATIEQLSAHPTVKRILTHDLKARLAMIKHLLAQPDSGHPFPTTRDASALARSVEALLVDMGHRQEEIVRRWNASEPFQMIHFWLPLQDIAGRAKLKIGFPRALAAQSRCGFHAALLLEFDHLGETRIDLFLMDRNLTTTFFVKTIRAKTFVEENVHEIRSALSPLFDHVQVNVSVSEKKIADFEFEDLQTADARRLDVRV